MAPFFMLDLCQSYPRTRSLCAITTAAVLAAVLHAIALPAHAASFGGGSGFVHDPEGKPIAGAHVIVYIMSRDVSNIPIPFARSSPVCGPDYYTTTDAEGRFSIPEHELAFPWKLSLLSERRPRFLPVVYAKDYVDTGIEVRAGLETRDGGDRKTGPIVLDVTMKRDTGTRVERAKYLSYIGGAGCGCWPFHEELNREFKTVLSAAQNEYDDQLGIKPGRPSVAWRPGNVMRCVE